MLLELLPAILFVISSGLLFNERFRRNRVVVGLTAIIAIVSTVVLTKEIVKYTLSEELVEMGLKPGAAKAEPSAAGATSPVAEPATAPAGDTPPASAPAPAPVTQDEAATVFQKYIDAWKSGDVATQEGLLAEGFVYVDQDKTQSRADYVAQKRRLAESYAGSQSSSIAIQTSNVQYGDSGDGAETVTYTQNYSNPKYWSVGTNVFTMRRIDGTVKIVREQFHRDSYGPQ